MRATGFSVTTVLLPSINIVDYYYYYIIITSQGEGGASSNNPSRSERRSPFKDPKSSCPGLRKERLKLAHGYSREGHEL